MFSQKLSKIIDIQHIFLYNKNIKDPCQKENKKMSEFPQRLKGEPLQKLYSKALETLSEEQIGYYKKLFYAFANLYGIIPIRKIYELLTDNYGMEISEKSFLDLCEYFRYEQESYFYIFGKEEYYQEDTSPASEPMDRLLAFDSFVEFDDAYELVLSLKEGKPWYVPPIEELEKYEDDLYFEKTKAFDSVIGFLKDEFKLDFIDSESKIYDAFFTLKLEDHNFNDFLDELQQSGLDITFERVQKLAPYYTELNNNTRMQANSGYTALPVLDADGSYVGVVTEGDLLWALKSICVMDMRQTEAHFIRDILPRRVIHPVKVDTRVEDLVSVAAEQNFVPVIDDKNAFIGIVTRSRILRYCQEQYFARTQKIS